MKETAKKKIAKEIVIFFSSVLCIVIIWTFFWLSNFYTLNRINNLENQILKLSNNTDSIKWDSPNGKDTLTFYSSTKDSVDVAVKDISSLLKHYPTEEANVRAQYNNTIPSNKNYCWVIYDKFKLERKNLTNDLSQAKSKVYSTNKLIKTTKWIGVIVLTIVYPLRFLFLLLWWAIKTLRTSAEIEGK